MNTIEMDYSFTGSRFIKAKPLETMRTMPSMAYDTLRVMYKYLSKEIGKFSTITILLKSWLVDLLFNPPKWDPAKFTFSDKAQEALFRKKFNTDGLYLIPVHNNLKRKFGEQKANEILFRVTIITGIPFLSKVFKPIPGIKHIDEFRQQMTDYLGGVYTDTMEEYISEDGTEVRYWFNRCPHIEIWKAYGLDGLACGACMADHLVFDNIIPQIVFSRTKTIGVGDSYCDHVYRIRQSYEKEWLDDYIDSKQEKRYLDAYKITRYKARNEIRKWRHHFIKNSGSFKY